MQEEDIMEFSYEQNDELYNKKIQPVPAPRREIGIDIDNSVIDTIVEVGEQKVNINQLEAFTSISQRRDQLYTMLDNMSTDPIVAAALEIYAEDATEANDDGRVVWVDSNDGNVQKYVEFLLDTLNIDKNMYKWTYSLCKYGDLYLRLFRESEVEDHLLDGIEQRNNNNYYSNNYYDRYILTEDKKQSLDEQVNIKVFKDSDKFIHYIEMIPNPAEMFELTKFGKTYAYIQAPTNLYNSNNVLANDGTGMNMLNQFYLNYSFRRNDIDVYGATEFVHGTLEDNASRFPEKVQIFLDDDKYREHEANRDRSSSLGGSGNSSSSSGDSGLSYSVKRGQSILYDVYKAWRNKSLLENSILLNRLTKSSIVRVVQVEVGDMPKEQVQPHIYNIKSLIEQKSALNVNESLNEYVNPGPIENTIYIPTRGGQGNLSVQQIGEDVDVKSLADLDYFQNQFFGATKIPKQYLGCLRGNTDILLLNGKKVTVEDMFNNKDSYIGAGIMACNADGSLQPTRISNIMLTKPSTDFIRIHLDNGEYVDVTNDHKMMLRDGRYILAEDLAVGDSLMPYYDYVKDGRRYVLDNKDGKYKPQYRVVAENEQTIPASYQVHHKDTIKINDDFTNLEVLSVKEHYAKHENTLHESNKKRCAERRSLGKPVSKHVGQRVINNGIRQYWINGDDELPVGYSYGTLPFSQDHKDKIKKALTGLKKNYDCVKNFGDNFSEKSKQTKLERKNAGLYDEQYRKKSEELKLRVLEKSGIFSEEAAEKRMARFPENRRNKNVYVRCLACGNVEQVRRNGDWYKKYLNKEVFWFCCDECRKLNKAGKLGRSYSLFINSNSDANIYENNRFNGDSRPDTFLKFDTLEQIIPTINDYSPECNHKVVGIEYINANEPAYDISVEADCHTFALPCGIFVHNCTDDATGFNGGTALSLTSSRYAKSIKRIQTALISMLTDAINLLLLDKGMDNYVNKFSLHMMPPTTQEELDRRDNLSNKLGLARDIIDMLSDIDDVPTKLTITKDLLSEIINDPDVLREIQDYIDKLNSENGQEEESSNDEFDFDSSNDDYNEEPSESSSGLSMNDDLADLRSEEPAESPDEEPSRELPSMNDTEINFADADAEI